MCGPGSRGIVIDGKGLGGPVVGSAGEGATPFLPWVIRGFQSAVVVGLSGRAKTGHQRELMVPPRVSSVCLRASVFGDDTMQMDRPCASFWLLVIGYGLLVNADR
jgi:hypothetical protein